MRFSANHSGHSVRCDSCLLSHDLIELDPHGLSIPAHTNTITALPPPPPLTAIISHPNTCCSLQRSPT